MSFPVYELYHDLHRAARYANRPREDERGTLAFVIKTVAVGALLFAGNLVARQLIQEMMRRSPPGRH